MYAANFLAFTEICNSISLLLQLLRLLMTQMTSLWPQTLPLLHPWSPLGDSVLQIPGFPPTSDPASYFCSIPTPANARLNWKSCRQHLVRVWRHWFTESHGRKTPVISENLLQRGKAVDEVVLVKSVPGVLVHVGAWGKHVPRPANRPVQTSDDRRLAIV